jgi:enoyl-[acyl-carrier protein] reductase I
MGFLAGKRLLITGVLSNRSIAYGIAKACHREGAELAFSYVGERFKERIIEFGRVRLRPGVRLRRRRRRADRAPVRQLGEHWPEFDGFVHAIAFAPREAIAGDFLDGLSREASASRTRSRPTASRRWPRPRCRACVPAPRC